MAKVKLSLTISEFSDNVEEFDMENHIFIGDITVSEVQEEYAYDEWFVDYRRPAEHFYNVTTHEYIFELNKIYCGISDFRNYSKSRKKYNIEGTLPLPLYTDTKKEHLSPTGMSLYYAKINLEETWTTSNGTKICSDDNYPIYCITDDETTLNHKYEWNELIAY